MAALTPCTVVFNDGNKIYYTEYPSTNPGIDSDAYFWFKAAEATIWCTDVAVTSNRLFLLDAYKDAIYEYSINYNDQSYSFLRKIPGLVNSVNLNGLTALDNDTLIAASKNGYVYEIDITGNSCVNTQIFQMLTPVGTGVVQADGDVVYDDNTDTLYVTCVDQGLNSVRYLCSWQNYSTITGNPSLTPFNYGQIPYGGVNNGLYFYDGYPWIVNQQQYGSSAQNYSGKVTLLNGYYDFGPLIGIIGISSAGAYGRINGASQRGGSGCFVLWPGWPSPTPPPTPTPTPTSILPCTTGCYTREYEVVAETAYIDVIECNDQLSQYYPLHRYYFSTPVNNRIGNIVEVCFCSTANTTGLTPIGDITPGAECGFECFDCKEIFIDSLGQAQCAVSYTECVDGRASYVVTNQPIPLTGLTICACETSVTNVGIDEATFTTVGPCTGITVPCNVTTDCSSIDLTNPSLTSSVAVSYVDCSGSTASITVLANSTETICACEETIAYEPVDNGEGGFVELTIVNNGVAPCIEYQNWYFLSCCNPTQYITLAIKPDNFSGSTTVVYDSGCYTKTDNESFETPLAYYDFPQYGSCSDCLNDAGISNSGCTCYCTSVEITQDALDSASGNTNTTLNNKVFIDLVDCSTGFYTQTTLNYSIAGHYNVCTISGETIDFYYYQDDATIGFSGDSVTSPTICSWLVPCAVPVSPSPSPTPSISISKTPSVTPSITPSISISPTPSISISKTPSVTPSITPSISVSNTPGVSATPSISISKTPSISISKTPSISITPSITPSTTSAPVTPTPSPSEEGFDIYSFQTCCSGLSPDKFRYNYVSGTLIVGQVFEITGGSGYNGCAEVIPYEVTGPIYYGSGVIFTEQENCEDCTTGYPCPSPTPTPSISISLTPSPTISISVTPSITPTPSCDCMDYTITNPNFTTVLLTYVDCYQTVQNISVLGYETVNLCACEGSLVYEGGDLFVTNTGECNGPSPTPQPSPSTTPAPTVTPSSGWNLCSEDFCLYSFDPVISLYNGNYTVAGFYDTRNYFQGDVIGFIYYNSTNQVWCLADTVGGTCIFSGPTPSTSVCPDLWDIVFTSGSCNTTTTTTSPCDIFDFTAYFDCDVPSPTPTISITPTPSITPSITPSVSSCIGVGGDITISGYTTTTTTIGPSPSPSTIVRNVVVSGTTTFSNEMIVVCPGDTYMFININTEEVFYVEPNSSFVGVILSTGFTYSMTINSVTSCYNYLGINNTSPNGVVTGTITTYPGEYECNFPT